MHSASALDLESPLQEKLQIGAPLIEIIWPERSAACSDARKPTRSATSSGLPARCVSSSALIVAASKTPSAIPVAMIPGATALTVVPRLAASRASDLLAACSAPFAAE